MSSDDPEILFEQAHLEAAHRDLDRMRARAESLLVDLRAAGAPDPDLDAALQRRVQMLAPSRRPLVFGRTDETSGIRWHIGRRHIEDDGGDERVVDWRADIAIPFYRARAGENLGLARRRQIMVEGEQVVAVADDLFESTGEHAETTRLRGGDALLAELERARTGEMLDIVATIQAEQDEIIRAPLAGVAVVQGGPGTGKTAVALHRTAFLVYNHPELAHSGVLVIGPSRAFLRYISQVLPSLGEETVLQLTIPDLVTKVRIRATDDEQVARVKGDARMAEVLASALALMRGEITEAISLSARHLIVKFSAEELNMIVGDLVTRRLPHATGRTTLRARLVSLARQRFRADGRFEADEQWFERELTGSKAFAPLLDRLWPRVSAHDLVNELFGDAELRERAARLHFDQAEIDLLQRVRPASSTRAQWTRSDIALIDEAHALVQGRGHTYGHVIVDEAQDLTPMELRMLSRRCPRNSMTLLGDIAQATGTFTYASWDELVQYLPESAEIRRDELTLGYRAPGQVLEFASRLLRVAAPSVQATSSVRRGRYEPIVTHVEVAELVPTAVREARRLAALGFLVGLIVPSGEIEQHVVATTRRAVDVGQLDRDGITMPITVVAAPSAKGLEFDAVVVVEPAAIASDGVRGQRLLYVALTRPIQSLSVVHCAPLPSSLAASHG